MFDYNKAYRLVKVTRLALHLNVENKEIRKLKFKVQECIDECAKLPDIDKRLFESLKKCYDLLERKESH